MDAFTRKFGVYSGKTGKYALESYFLSLLNSLTYIGFAFGLVTGNYISRRWGRKICMFTMCIWAVVGAIILTTSQHKEQANCCICLGQLVQSLICRGPRGIQDDRAWRIPLGLFFIVPSITAVGVWFMDESLRWLLMKGREEDARASLQALREGKFTQTQIDAELEEQKLILAIDEGKGRIVEIFRGFNMKRTLIVVGVDVFLQLTGQNFSSVYGTIFIKSIGTVNPFTMASVTSLSISSRL
ncbi:uncharacterized protein Z518_06852 [Rhinocladiella mackenziei CBS 650.93]|uniref:Rhinocladiella mackenziei CBS 650.93 unplaced genomic scaffold supercont1.5, whole genome shotgun sequence n=1 Tax=Rhinocladiella mackenziei CBS 650.93 TaxID=1442369 RepID=A0A0D2J2V1_9EURO|nr:uncharacterized protein Z518_06852 [Rhinocladiella mackenziei CBS 650.93]KIX03300.1 hypothetical protein Z518_06852 [Rhinocladiella mackenziei CBS 650.93]